MTTIVKRSIDAKTAEQAIRPPPKAAELGLRMCIAVTDGPATSPPPHGRRAEALHRDRHQQGLYRRLFGMPPMPGSTSSRTIRRFFTASPTPRASSSSAAASPSTSRARSSAPSASAAATTPKTWNAPAPPWRPSGRKRSRPTPAIFLPSFPRTRSGMHILIGAASTSSPSPCGPSGPRVDRVWRTRCPVRHGSSMRPILEPPEHSPDRRGKANRGRGTMPSTQRSRTLPSTQTGSAQGCRAADLTGRPRRPCMLGALCISSRPRLPAPRP